MVMEFTGVHEHIVAWGNVHWSTIGIGHGDPGTGVVSGGVWVLRMKLAFRQTMMGGAIKGQKW